MSVSFWKIGSVHETAVRVSRGAENHDVSAKNIEVSFRYVGVDNEAGMNEIKFSRDFVLRNVPIKGGNGRDACVHRQVISSAAPAYTLSLHNVNFATEPTLASLRRCSQNFATLCKSARQRTAKQSRCQCVMTETVHVTITPLPGWVGVSILECTKLAGRGGMEMRSVDNAPHAILQRTGLEVKNEWMNETKRTHERRGVKFAEPTTGVSK